MKSSSLNASAVSPNRTSVPSVGGGRQAHSVNKPMKAEVASGYSYTVMSTDGDPIYLMAKKKKPIRIALKMFGIVPDPRLFLKCQFSCTELPPVNNL